MMKQNTQRGDALTITIITILVIALLATLGYIFWSKITGTNDNPKKEETSQTTTNNTATQQPGVKLIDGKASQGTFSVAWRQPETWKATSEQTSGTESVKITSPSGKYTVSYRISSNPTGVTCDPSSMKSLSFVNKKAADASTGAAFAEVIYPTTGGFTYSSSLFSTKMADSFAVGSDVCEVVSNLVTFNGINLQSSITANNLDTGTVSSVDTIKNALSGEEYNQAVDILLSTKVQK